MTSGTWRWPRPAQGELANTLSHGVGLLLAVAAVPILVVNAVVRGSAADVVGAAIFGSTLVVLYLSSTVYHLSLIHISEPTRPY